MIKPEVALSELRRFKEQALNDLKVQQDGPTHREWKSKVVATLEHGLGRSSTVLKQFSDLRY